REIVESATRAAALVRQLLAFGRRQTLEPRLIDLRSVVGGMKPILKRAIAHGIELVDAADTCPCVVRADPVQLEQVILNLVINARDAMPGGGRLTVETRSEFAVQHGLQRDWVVLSVSDNGVGMDERTLSRIFEPFYTTKG